MIISYTVCVKTGHQSETSLVSLTEIKSLTIQLHVFNKICRSRGQFIILYLLKKQK